MILRRVRVHPFGCFSDNELAFSAGLNVVLGPNEAGKSTIFKAIRHALFVRAKLAKRAFDDHVTPYLPVSGGDSVRVEIECDAPGGRYVLSRRWGTAHSSELTLPGGGSLSDEDAIAAKLGEILPAGPATTSNILMTEQAALSSTLDVLRDKAKQSLTDLTDMLRSAVLSTGGISVDGFVARLSTLRADAWLRWDKAARGPEGGRGIERKWKNDVGAVLKAWYAAQEARAAWQKAMAFDQELDDVNSRLRAAGALRAEREAFVRANVATARDARERRTLEAELRAARGEAEAARKVSAEWPVAVARQRDLAEAAAAAAAARAALEAEHGSAQKAEEARGLREKHERVLRRKTELDQLRARIAATPGLDRKALDEIRAAASAVQRLEAGVEAGAISVTVAARADIELLVQEDFKPEDRRALSPGRTTRLRAGGRVRIVHRDMEIEVRSGDSDADARAEKAAAARATLSSLLVRHGIPDVEAAEERGRTHESLAADARAAEKNLAEELGGESLESLQSRAAALVPVTAARPLAAVAAELAAARAQAEARTRELLELSRRIGEWEEKHGTLENLMTGLAVAKGRETDLASRIEQLAPLPQGYTEAGVFLEAFEKAQAGLAGMGQELGTLLGRKSALEEKPPEQSAEELAAQAKDADHAFQAALRRAEALDRLLERSNELLARGDSDIFSGMSARLSETLAAMTAGRHSGVVMEGAVPVGLGDAPGRAVAWDQLSAGTRDTLALALRLAMASYFLGDADGFLLMDDPLVDMDPDRQRAAAAALKDFAATRQLVLFTCHPGTAELLGGNLLPLAPAG